MVRKKKASEAKSGKQVRLSRETHRLLGLCSAASETRFDQTIYVALHRMWRELQFEELKSGGIGKKNDGVVL